MVEDVVVIMVVIKNCYPKGDDIFLLQVEAMYPMTCHPLHLSHARKLGGGGRRWAVCVVPAPRNQHDRKLREVHFHFRERERSVHGVTCQSNTFLCTEKLSAIQ